MNSFDDVERPSFTPCDLYRFVWTVLVEEQLTAPIRAAMAFRLAMYLLVGQAKYKGVS